MSIFYALYMLLTNHEHVDHFFNLNQINLLSQQSYLAIFEQNFSAKSKSVVGGKKYFLGRPEWSNRIDSEYYAYFILNTFQTKVNFAQKLPIASNLDV